MLADSAFVYFAMHEPHKHAHGDPLLLLFMLMFFAWVAYLFIIVLWFNDPTEKQREQRDDESGLD
jgi:hypothetical protein